MPSDLCFVLMPFGKKPDVSGTIVDFDAVYRDLIAPAIRDAGLDPIRADEEMTGGIIHRPMFERLIFCKFAVADLTTANANVFYELGVRHSVRPWSTVLIYSKGGSQLPFDVAPLRAMPYTLAPDGTPADLKATREALAKRLLAAREAAGKKPEKKDSPVYELVENYPDVDHTKTDEFRDRVEYSAEQKKKLAAARRQGPEALRAAEKEMGDFRDVESGVLIDLFLSYRAVEAWNDMIGLAERMPPELASTVMVKEQLALALNRAGRGEEAEKVLEDLIASRGPSSETYGILGRVYKDRWRAAARDGKAMQARGLLDKAIRAYLKGFEADWRDAYPGVNAVTLMEIKDPRHPGRQEVFPVVSYAVERKIAAGKPDYWDYATRLELAVLDKDEEKATQALSDALANVREPWEPKTTVDNLRLIREARQGRGDEVAWAKEAEEALAAWRKQDAS
jgi:tetratricopeptide (TPR) repeat protein